VGDEEKEKKVGEDEDEGIGDKELVTLMEGRLKRYRAVKQRLAHVESEKDGLEIENSDLRVKLLQEQRENARLAKEVESLSLKLSSILQNVAKLSSSVPDDSAHPRQKNNNN